MRELPLLQSPVPLGIGRPIGGLSFLVKALLQGAVFNNTLPDTALEKLLFIVAQTLDLCCWLFLVSCTLSFYCNFIWSIL